MELARKKVYIYILTYSLRSPKGNATPQEMHGKRRDVSTNGPCFFPPNSFERRSTSVPRVPPWQFSEVPGCVFGGSKCFLTDFILAMSLGNNLFFPPFCCRTPLAHRSGLSAMDTISEYAQPRSAVPKDLHWAPHLPEEYCKIQFATNAPPLRMKSLQNTHVCKLWAEIQVGAVLSFTVSVLFSTATSQQPNSMAPNNAFMFCVCVVHSLWI